MWVKWLACLIGNHGMMNWMLHITGWVVWTLTVREWMILISWFYMILGLFECTHNVEKIKAMLFILFLAYCYLFFMFWCITSQTVSIVFHLGFLMYCKTQAYIFKDLRSPCLQCLRSERLARKTFITLFSFPCWRLCRSVWLDTSHNLRP